MTQNKQEKEFVTTRQAAEMLGVSLRTAQLWVENEILSAWKTAGGHRRITLQSVEDLLERQREALQQDGGGKSELTVLVVEDVAYLRRLYTNTIESWGLPVKLIMASNGFDGLFQLGNHKPDLLITDLHMPGMDGFRMLWALIEGHTVEASDILVVTELKQKEIDANGGLPEGVHQFHKPIPFDDVRKIVMQKLETNQVAVAAV